MVILTNDGSGNLIYSATRGTDANPFFCGRGGCDGFWLADLISANNGSTTLSLFYNLPYPPLISSLQKTGAQNDTISWLSRRLGLPRQDYDFTAEQLVSLGGPVNDDGSFKA